MRVNRLHADFGAEVLDCKVLDSPAPQQLAALRAAYDSHQLLLFRCGEPITPQRQVEISSWFGPPVSNGGDGGLWSVLRNDEAAGRVRLAFHSDLSYTDSPIQGISLHALDVPASGTSTSFVSGVHAWSSLPLERQQWLAGMTLRHRLDSKLFGDWPEFIADHPVRLLHPRTSQPVLYVTEHHAQRIHELAPQESDRVLGELFAHLYAPQRVYTHHWKRYDLLIWDNLAIQHARCQDAQVADGVRTMQRVALSEVTFAELVERARRVSPQALRASH
jgi:taurine dioxygenase